MKKFRINLVKQNQKLGSDSVLQQSTTVSSVQCLEPSVQSVPSRVQHPESRVQGPASRVQRPGSRVPSLASRVQRPTLASRVQEFRYASKLAISLLELTIFPFLFLAFNLMTIYLNVWEILNSHIFHSYLMNEMKYQC